MKFIKYQNVYKYYESFCALSDVSLEIKGKGVHALLGPNGAGKTSTLNCLIRKEFQDIGIIESEIPTSSINYLPENPPLIEDVKVLDYLKFCRSLKSSNEYFSMNELIERLELKDFKNKIISNLSKGNKQKINLVQAFLGHPNLIILDEPNTNIDPKIIRIVRNLIHELKNEVSFLISSHQLLEVDAIADDITILNDGAVLFTGSKRELLGNKKELHFILKDENDSGKVFGLFKEKNISTFQQDNSSFKVEGIINNEMTALIDEISSRVAVSEIYSQTRTLEQAYFKEFPL